MTPEQQEEHEQEKAEFLGELERDLKIEEEYETAK